MYKDVFVKEHYFNDFHFFNVGHEQCEKSHSHGLTIREEYVVHYIESGKGFFEVSGRKYNLVKGDFFIIKPNDLTYYEADDKSPWEYFWLGFSGDKVEELLLTNGIGKHDYVGKVDSTVNLNPLFQEILLSNVFDDREKLKNQARFLKIFSYFKLNDNLSVISSLESRKRKYSDSFTLYIKNNYDREELTIKEISRSMNLNSAYLSQVIKEEIGYSPKEYLKEFRLRKANFLLETTNMLVSEIASSVGYKNSDSFSRAFKNHYGVSPSYFSENIK